VLVLVEVEELDLERTCDVRLVVNAVVELKGIDLDCAVRAGRVVPLNGEGQGSHGGQADRRPSDQCDAGRPR
jgi:hypothetical protein